VYCSYLAKTNRKITDRIKFTVPLQKIINASFGVSKNVLRSFNHLITVCFSAEVKSNFNPPEEETGGWIWGRGAQIGTEERRRRAPSRAPYHVFSWSFFENENNVLDCDGRNFKLEASPGIGIIWK
jgi:hypothetical protein